MWMFTNKMNSFFFKVIDFKYVTKIIIGCRGNNKSIEQAIQSTKNPSAAGKFYCEGEFIDVLLARPSEERFELDFKEYKGNFLSMFT